MDKYNENMSGLIDNPRLYSTVHVCLLDKNFDVAEALYGEAAEYRENINNAITDFLTQDYPTNDLMRYFSLPGRKTMEASIREKIQSAKLVVCSVYDTLYAVLDLNMSADLIEDEFKAFQQQIESQYRDGWGAEFELQNIKTGGPDVVCLRLSYDGVTFYTADEFDALIIRQVLGHKTQDLEQDHIADIPDCIRQFAKLEKELQAQPGLYGEWVRFSYETFDVYEVTPSEFANMICDSFRKVNDQYGVDIARALYGIINDGALLPNEILNAAGYLNSGGKIEDVPEMALNGSFETQWSMDSPS